MKYLGKRLHWRSIKRWEEQLAASVEFTIIMWPYKLSCFLNYLMYSLYPNTFPDNFIPNLVHLVTASMLLTNFISDLHFSSLSYIQYLCFCCMCDNEYKVHPVLHFLTPQRDFSSPKQYKQQWSYAPKLVIGFKDAKIPPTTLKQFGVRKKKSLQRGGGGGNGFEASLPVIGSPVCYETDTTEAGSFPEMYLGGRCEVPQHMSMNVEQLTGVPMMGISKFES
uniref:Uncharacterized protein n=1 Tax=Timema poppense TaxID=170557 RepID=A0A7R9DAP6_TIMPO|nr:unnamed protein product [Timema poppensis]